MLHPNPFRQFHEWFQEALQSGASFPDAMNLSTCTSDGRPSARVVLHKALDDRGFVFFTNYESRKGRELDQKPIAALTFYWPNLGRQVRVEGPVEKISARESDDYFKTRPRESQIGAWASRQSEEIGGREELIRCYEEIDRKYAGKEVPRPPHWGGYRVLPDRIEFWINQSHRLHDRFVYTRVDVKSASWKQIQLSP